MRACLDDIVLPADSGAGWRLQDGVEPHIQDIKVPIEMAERLLKSAKPLGTILELKADDEAEKRGVQVIKKLTILGPTPSPDPYHVVLRVADRRYLWKYGALYRAFNIRRRTGNRRRVGAGLALAAQRVVDDEAYATYSLVNGKRAWDPIEALESVLAEIVGAEFEIRGVKGIVDLPDLESVVLDAQQGDALAELLAEFGGLLAIHIAAEGTTVIRNKFNDRERLLVGLTPQQATTDVTVNIPAIAARPYFVEQDRSRESPSLYRVLFERQEELRFDGREGGAVTTLEAEEAPPTLTNVLPSPEDFEFEGRKIVVGQLIELSFFLRFLVGRQPAKLPALSLKLIRELWLSPALDAYGNTALDPSGLWQKRISAIRRHYRVTWQIDYVWRSRIKEMFPERVAVEDSETNSRAPALVISNYAKYDTWRAIGDSRAAQPGADLVLQNSYANNQAFGGRAIIGVNYTLLTPAQAFVTKVDSDLGLIEIEYGTGSDMRALASDIVRGAVDVASNPTDRLDGRRQHLQEAALDSDFQISIILSATMGAPADKRRYHVVDVKPEDAFARLPVRKRPINPNGPVMEIRVPPVMSMARFGWQDAQSGSLGDQYRPGLLENIALKITGGLANEAEVQAVADAYAARHVLRFLDRIEGNLTTALAPGTDLDGAASAVSFEADSQLGAITSIEMPRDQEFVDVVALLPRAVRRTVLRQVNLNGGVTA